MSTLSLIAAVVMLGFSAYLFAVVSRLPVFQEPPPPDLRHRFNRMLVVVGMWQWSIGFVIISIPNSDGAWVNSIALFLMGTFLMFTPKLQRTFNPPEDS